MTPVPLRTRSTAGVVGVVAAVVVLTFAGSASARPDVSAEQSTTAAGQPSTTARASAGTEGYCPDDTGVTVVVDLSELDGDVVVRCAPGPVAAGFTGIDALHDAGFTVTGTQRYGLAFVCRIQGRPAADETLAIPGDPDYHEQCVDTPPESAFWGYWYAPNGGQWTYSTVGASSHDAIQGGFEGWAFSLGDREGSNPAPGVDPTRPGSGGPSPTSAPPPTPAPPHHRGGGGAPPPGATSTPPAGESSTSPPTTAAHTTAPAGAAATRAQPVDAKPGARGSSTARSSSSGTTPTAPARSSSHGAADTPTGTPPDGTRRHASTGPGPSATGTSTAGGDQQVTGELPDNPEQPAGSARATLVGLALLVVLGLGAGLTAWRRSHRP